MEAREFSQARHELGKTQNQIARLLCVSPKAVQSFEQEWRKVPASVERQLMFLLYLKNASGDIVSPCWETKDCPGEWRKECAAWEFRAGNLCWFINGTNCRGMQSDCWQNKLETCRQCEVFQSVLPPQVYRPF
ncbi:MAG: helix-turn-helix transcriptional regulator [Dehalococcoidales bacterium]|nr:helix-turn-helix transcriptional regulator [Dehalococcoidales bacterium]